MADQPRNSRNLKVAAMATPIALAAAALEPMSAAAATDMFLKIEGIEGESQDAEHKGEIDVLAWSWNLSYSGTTHTGTGGTTGQANINDIKVVKYTDKATPVIMLALAAGKQYPSATLTVRQIDSKVPVLRIELENVLFTRLAQGGDGADDRLTETVALNFNKVTIFYQQTNPDGSPGTETSVGWDIATNQPL